METTNVKLYGAWVTLTGELIPVPEECHFEIAVEILYPGSVHVTPEQFQTVYSDMYNNRYLRLIFCSSGGFKIEHKAGQKISKKQESYIDNAVFVGIY